MNRFTFLTAAFLSAAMMLSSVAQTNSTSKPMVTPNPDGTFTVQKALPSGNSKDTNADKGLSIPAQVVVPLVPSPERKPDAASRR
jgi:hypothetical protein